MRLYRARSEILSCGERFLPGKWFNFLKRPRGKNGKPRFSVKIKKVDFSDNIYHTGWSNFVPVSKIKRNHDRWCDIKQMIAQPRMRNRWKTPAHGSSVQEPREIIRNFSSKVWGCNNRFHSLYKFILHLRIFSNSTEARVDRIES